MLELVEVVIQVEQLETKKVAKKAAPKKKVAKKVVKKAAPKKKTAAKKK